MDIQIKIKCIYTTETEEIPLVPFARNCAM
jgi:hypothetical protein